MTSKIKLMVYSSRIPSFGTSSVENDAMSIELEQSHSFVVVCLV